jgi:hypoxanthine phosphoribosyltransferase
LSESKKVNYSWDSIDNLVTNIHNRASHWKPTHIVGITRGGLIPAVMLSHRLDLPMEVLGVSFRDNKATHHTKFKPIPDARYLVVDDINDSGMTFSVVSQVFKNRHLHFVTAALINKEKSGFSVDFYGEMFYDDDWINFPWENK